MIIVAVGAAWGTYGLATWGWILVKGYNITFAQWFNPMKPYYWPDPNPPTVPQGHLFPTGQGTSATSTAAKVQVA